MRTLKDIFVAMAGVLSTVLPVILALKPTPVVLGTNACAMSAQEIATIQSTMMGRNASCLYNMTLDSILLL